MTTRVYFEGPKPLPGPLGYCAMCAMIHASAAREAAAAAVQEAQASGKDVAMVRMGQVDHAAFPLMPAVAWGLYGPWTVPPLGAGGTGVSPFPMPLCWTHLMGITLTDSLAEQMLAGRRLPGGGIDLSQAVQQGELKRRQQQG